MVLRDVNSGYVQIYPAKVPSADHFLPSLYNWCIMKTPKCLVVDNQLNYSKMGDKMDKLGFVVKPTIVYFHRSNGVVERVHRDILSYLRQLLVNFGSPVSEWINYVDNVETCTIFITWSC